MGGAGSTTSDSNVVRLSRGEGVIKASSAMQARPLLKMFNENPKGAIAAVATAGSAGVSKVVHNHLHIDGSGLNPDALFMEFGRRTSMHMS